MSMFWSIHQKAIWLSYYWALSGCRRNNKHRDQSLCVVCFGKIYSKRCCEGGSFFKDSGKHIWRRLQQNQQRQKFKLLDLKQTVRTTVRLSLISAKCFPTDWTISVQLWVTLSFKLYFFSKTQLCMLIPNTPVWLQESFDLMALCQTAVNCRLIQKQPNSESWTIKAKPSSKWKQVLYFFGEFEFLCSQCAFLPSVEAQQIGGKQTKPRCNFQG